MTIPSLPMPLPSRTAMTPTRPPSAYVSASPSAASRSAYGNLLARLCERSVTKHHDAYADVDWDRPEHRIDARDPRFALGDDEPLADTAWYRAQPAEVRARLGLHLLASRTRIGIAFENILSRGLLEFAGTCARGSLEFRYAHHEVIEESQHSLMFQELVNRIGIDVDGMRALDVMGARGVPRLGRVFPELFFLQTVGLGDRFEASLDSVFRQIESMPGLAPVIYRDVRRVTIPKFPFAVYYRIEGGEVVVWAVVHARRDPDRWKSRF